MSLTRRLTVELPDKLVRRVEEKVASGAYASESDVVRDGLEALDDLGPSDEWLRAEVLPVLDACRRDPSRLMPLDEVFARLESRFAVDRGSGGSDA